MEKPETQGDTTIKSTICLQRDQKNRVIQGRLFRADWVILAGFLRHANCSLAHLGRKFGSGFAHDDSIVSNNGASSKPGAVQQSELDYCPVNPYGESKVIGEKLVRSNPPMCTRAIVRPTSIWGPWFKEPYRSFFEYVLRGLYFHVGKTRIRKTYGYVGNAICQIEALMHAQTKLINGNVFYLGDSSEYIIRDWAESIARRNKVHIPEIPLVILKMAAFTGDIFKKFGLQFPITSFRLRNMTTENCIDLSPIFNIVSNLPFDRESAIDLTLHWMNEHP